MSAIAVLPAEQVETMVTRFEEVVNRLVAAEKELALLKEDQLVGWDWVCNYLDVDQKTARQMLQNEQVFVYGRKVKKFRRSDVVRFAENNSIKVKQLENGLRSPFTKKQPK